MPILALQLQQNSHQETHPKPGLRKLQDETVDPRFDTVRSTATVSPVCHRGSAAILVLSAVERAPLICISYFVHYFSCQTQNENELIKWGISGFLFVGWRQHNHGDLECIFDYLPDNILLRYWPGNRGGQKHDTTERKRRLLYGVSTH